MAKNKEKIYVRMHPQYKGTATGGVITGYLVYAYIGHPLLGKVRGTERIFKDKKKAEAYTKQLRLLISFGGWLRGVN